MVLIIPEKAASTQHAAGDDTSTSSSADVQVQREALLTEELAESCAMKMFTLHADGSHLSQVPSRRSWRRPHSGSPASLLQLRLTCTCVGTLAYHTHGRCRASSDMRGVEVRLLSGRRAGDYFLKGARQPRQLEPSAHGAQSGPGRHALTAACSPLRCHCGAREHRKRHRLDGPPSRTRRRRPHHRHRRPRRAPQSYPREVRGERPHSCCAFSH